jgi:hypothetical protein
LQSRLGDDQREIRDLVRTLARERIVHATAHPLRQSPAFGPAAGPAGMRPRCPAGGSYTPDRLLQPLATGARSKSFALGAHP